MKKLKFTSLITVVLLVFSILFQVGSSFAEEETSNVTVRLGEVSKEEEEQLVNRKLKLWKIDEDPDKYRDDKVKIDTAGKLEKLTNEELNEKYKEVFYSEDTYVEDGKLVAKINNLTRGAYFVSDNDEDEGKEIKIDKKFIVLIPQEAEEDITPKEYSSIEVLKVDKDNHDTVLAGVKFKLYKRDGVPVPTINGTYDENGSHETLITDEYGKIYLSKLPNGDYYLQEIEAPAGYEMYEKKNSFNVPRAKQILITNKKVSGRYKFKKVSSKDNKGLKGAQFVIQEKDEKGNFKNVKEPGSKNDYIVTSDEKGNFEVDNLPFKDYYLLEMKAPTGYEKLNDRVKFTVNKNYDARTHLTIKNKPINPPDETPPGKTPSDKPNRKTPPGRTSSGNSGGRTSTRTGTSSSVPRRRISVPKTGDIVVILLTLAGILFVIMGVRLIKDTEKEKSA